MTARDRENALADVLRAMLDDSGPTDHLRQRARAALAEHDAARILRGPAKRRGAPGFVWTPEDEARLRAMRESGEPWKRIVPAFRLADTSGVMRAVSARALQRKWAEMTREADPS